MQVVEEGIDLTNAVALSFVLDSLPKLPTAVQGKIYRDILGLLNRNATNREIFRSNPSWHLSLFSLTSSLIKMDSPSKFSMTCPKTLVKNMQMKGDLEFENDQVQDLWEISDKKINEELGSKSGTLRGRKNIMLSVDTLNLEGTRNVTSSIFSPLSLPTPLDEPTDLQKDAWFQQSMEVYSNLLSRAMDSKSGWREVEKTLSQSKTQGVMWSAYNVPKYCDIPGNESKNNSQNNNQNYNQNQRNNDMIAIQTEDDSARDATNREMEKKGDCVARAALSNLISEMTVSIRIKYKDLQRLARSNRFKENQAGLDRMENILTLILSSSQYVLSDVCCSGDGVGDLHIGRLRAHYFNEVVEEKIIQENLVLESKATLQSFEDGVFTEIDPESPGDCSCLTSSLPKSRGEYERESFSPTGASGGAKSLMESSTIELQFCDANECTITSSKCSNNFDLAEERLLQRHYNEIPDTFELASNKTTSPSNSFTDMEDFTRSWMHLENSEIPQIPGQVQVPKAPTEMDRNILGSTDPKINSSSRSLSLPEITVTLKR